MNSDYSRSRHWLAGVSPLAIACVIGTLLWMLSPSRIEKGYLIAGAQAEAMPITAPMRTKKSAKVQWCIQTPTHDCRPKACKSGKPVMVLFTAKWCGYCKHLKNKVIPDAKVQILLKKFSRIAIDVDVNPELVQESGVTRYPTFFIIGKGCEKMLEVVKGTPKTPKAFIKQFARHAAH